MASETRLLMNDEKKPATPQVLLYPLRFEPIYQYRLWGGRRLADLLTEPLPSGPIGEAWILSDRDDHQSRVADGALKGRTIGQLLEQFPYQMLGKLARRFPRFPLLLKFLDVHEMLSVEVHPTKANKNLLPAGETPKTEAWVVLEAGQESCQAGHPEPADGPREPSNWPAQGAPYFFGGDWTAGSLDGGTMFFSRM
jgi:phosphomannose isomerase type I-like protein